MILDDYTHISGIACNSDSVVPGGVFVALKGKKVNGEDFIDQAISNGAKHIVLNSNANVFEKEGVTYHYVKDPRITLSQLSAWFYKSQPKNMVAVTGTNGKTSVVSFFQQICDLLGFKSASIGTLGTVSSTGRQYEDSVLTTPDPITLHKILSQLSKDGIDYAGIEVSSHALKQHRVDGLTFKAAGFTNFTQDHLDYHKGLDDYFNAKSRLFKELLPTDGIAVLNADMNRYSIIRKHCVERGIKIFSYGINGVEMKVNSFYPKWDLDIYGNRYLIDVIFDADFQLYNVLCAVGLVLGCVNVNINEIINVLPKLKSASGRFEKVGLYNDASIYVDYAHTPDALKNVLLNAKKISSGKVHVVFGCGGERDADKRRKMGKIAAQLADNIIITDDNPRNENPKEIRRQILEGCRRAKEVFPREDAIKIAILDLKKGDILFIVGKGHEDYQIIGDEKVSFDDKKIVKKIINAL